jgi:branched-chain amino acid transport system ATP-binding protein
MSAPPELKLHGVTKRFGGIVAVTDVSMALTAGSVTGLIGPNGAGKSTLINLVSGFRRPDTGRIMFADHDLTRLDPSAIARLGISRTFQQAAPLVGLSVIENVMVGLHTRYRSGLGSILLRSPAMRREARANAQTAYALLEQFGLAADVHAEASDLPFGKLRFLELARAIGMQPQVVLLDEPAAGLNGVETDRLAALIRVLRDRGITVLLVDHDVPFVFGLCDQVVVMNFGSVIAAGKPDDVYGNPAVREAYLGGEDQEAAA